MALNLTIATISTGELIPRDEKSKISNGEIYSHQLDICSDLRTSSESDEQVVVPIPGEVKLGQPTQETSTSSHIEHDPMSLRDQEHATSNCDTMIHLLKGNVGTGILAMADALKHSGLWVGTVSVMLMGIVCVHCMHVLVNTSHEMCYRLKKPFMDYADVAEAAFMTTNLPGLKKYCPIARIVVNSFLCITQFGFCCIYFVFVASNIKQVMDVYFTELSLHAWLGITLLPVILLCWIKNLKYLSPFSMIANTFLFVGLGVSFYYLFQDLPSISSRKAAAPIEQMPLFFGTAIYAFEGIGVILPLENKMKTPHDLRGCNGVLNTGMVIVTCMYTATGFFGYLKYGDEATGSITLNLPRDEMLAQSVKLLIAVSIFLTFALQFYVPFGIIWPHIKRRIPNERMEEKSIEMERTRPKCC